MLNRYPHIVARIFNTPLMIHPPKLDAIIAGLGTRFGLPEGALPSSSQRQMYDSLPGERRKPGYRVHGPVAVIDVYGILTHRGSFDMNTSEYLLGYQDVSRLLDAAMRDRGVEAIVLNIDSPGGEVDGVFQLAAQIRRAAGVKPVRAVVDGVGASAAYLLASAANDITAIQTSSVGSIGVVMRHADFSKALANEGITVTQIFAGKHKVDGNPFEPLPVDVRAQFQREVESVYVQFVAAVANYRRMDEAAVRATEAQVYLAPEAVTKKLADRVGTVDQVVAELMSATGGRGRTALTSTGAQKMTDKLFTQAEVDAASTDAVTKAVAAAQTKFDAQLKDNSEKVLKDERARVAGIFGHAEAKGRTLQAIKIATTTDLSVEQAGALMAGTPVEQQAAKPSTPSLAAVGNASVGADAPAVDEGDERIAGRRAVAALTGRPLQS